MLDMIRAEEARQIASSANPEEEHAEADTLAENAMGWATRNAMARTNTRVRMYAKYGRTSLAVKFAPASWTARARATPSTTICWQTATRRWQTPSAPSSTTASRA